MYLLEGYQFARLPIAALEHLRRVSTCTGRACTLVYILHTVAYVPSPSFSSCWNELGWRRLSMTGTTGMIWPSPRLRTLMDESVRKGTASVPACVALSSPGGGLSVNLGSQRMADAVTNLPAMRSVERTSSAGGGALAGAGCAVLVGEKRQREKQREKEGPSSIRVAVVRDRRGSCSAVVGSMSRSGAKQPWRLPLRL